MRICLVSKEYPPEATGGIGTQTFLKAHALRALGHDVHVVTSVYVGTPGVADEAGVRVHRIADPAEQAPFAEPSVHWLAYSHAVAAKLVELAGDPGLDVIEFAEYEAEGFVYELETSQGREIPAVVMLHGSLAMFAERTGWPEVGTAFHRVGTFMEETVVRGADLLLAASRNIADFWIDERGVDPGAIHVVRTAVDPTAFIPGSNADNGRLDVLFVGRIDSEKGVFDVVDAIGELAAATPALRCRIAGSGDLDSEQALRRRIDGSRAPGAFDLLGNVPHDLLPVLYASSDVFAAPAPRDHGIATVYLEAMAAGLPVIASTTGGAPEAVVDGETGVLVPPGDQDALVRALESLLASPEKRQSLGGRGRERVLDCFTAAHVAEQTLEAYERVVRRVPEWSGA